MHNIFILGHIGLGDQILCNGLIRHCASRCDALYLPVKYHNINNISDMLKDVKNINFLSVSDDNQMLNYLSITKNIVNETISIGIFGKNFMKDTTYFDQSFYNQANINYNLRWNNFIYTNNVEKQNSLLEKINKEYIFIHDDESRNLKITKNINNNLNLFKPNHKLGEKNSFTIFDYIKVIENAKEIHCMDSSFACLIDHMPELKDKPKFIHRYIRKNNNNPFYKNNWIIYE